MDRNRFWGWFHTCFSRNWHETAETETFRPKPLLWFKSP